MRYPEITYCMTYSIHSEQGLNVENENYLIQSFNLISIDTIDTFDTSLNSGNKSLIYK